MNEILKVATGRRAFLKRAAVVGGAAAVAGSAAVAEVAPESPNEAAPEQRSKNYRMTPHIEAYYRSTRS